MMMLDSVLDYMLKFGTLAGVFTGIYVSLRNGRVLGGKASKADVHEVHELVNGKTAKLEKMIAEKGFEAGVKAEKAKKS